MPGMTIARALLVVVLSAASVRAVETPLVDVFAGGEGDYHTFRIPSLLVTRRGTLLAFAEGRVKGRGDAGDIDLVLKRSADGGRTWGKIEVVWNDADHTCGNPCPVVDRSTGAIWLLMTRNLGTDKEDAIKKGTSNGTRECWVTSSTDDGVTWAPPKDITASTKQKDWRWYATGPGVGIQLKSGRLLIPCDNSRADAAMTFQSHVIYSDDHGTTWKTGGVVGPKMNECQAAELSDGSVVLNMRSYRGRGCRAVATSKDGGLTFGDIIDVPELPDPTCQASLIAHQGNLVFANAADPTKRERMTVKLSPDDGKTWSAGKVIYQKSSAYSCLGALPDGRIGLLFERDNYSKISFGTMALQELTN
jgi:sialidase-1